MKITRRDVLRMGLGASALAFAPARLFAEGVCPKSIPIALQLYSINGITGVDDAEILETVAEMGYTGVEFSGTFGKGKDAKTLRKLLDDTGLKYCGAHAGMSGFEGDELKRNIEKTLTLGSKYLCVPWWDTEKSVDAWKKGAEWFNEKSALCQKEGVFTGYHNHQHEFKDHNFDGVTGWEILFQNTDDAVTHQIDIGHCAGAGHDPVKYIRMFPGRSRTVHMKENGGGGVIGKGSVDWPAVITALAEVGGTDWFVVESEIHQDTYDDVRACVKNLSKLIADM